MGNKVVLKHTPHLRDCTHEVKALHNSTYFFAIDSAFCCFILNVSRRCRKVKRIIIGGRIYDRCSNLRYLNRRLLHVTHQGKGTFFRKFRKYEYNFYVCPLVYTHCDTDIKDRDEQHENELSPRSQVSASVSHEGKRRKSAIKMTPRRDSLRHVKFATEAETEPAAAIHVAVHSQELESDSGSDSAPESGHSQNEDLI